MAVKGLNSFMYVRDKAQNGITYLRYEDYVKCKIHVSTSNDSIIRAPTEHNHPPNPARVAVAKSKARMWGWAVSSSKYTSNIQSETHAMSLVPAGVLPKKTSLQWIVQRKCACPEGNDLIDKLRATLRGEGFILTEDDQNRFYMFASQKPIGFVTVHLMLPYLVISCTRYTYWSIKITLFRLYMLQLRTNLRLCIIIFFSCWNNSDQE